MYKCLAIVTLFFVIGCGKPKPPMTEPPPTVYKENAYELNLLTQKLPDGRRLFQLNKTIYFKGQVMKRSVVSLDTLSAIGRDTATIFQEDEDGEQSVEKLNTDKEYDVLFKVDTLVAGRSMGYSWDTSTVVKKDSLHSR